MQTWICVNIRTQKVQHDGLRKLSSNLPSPAVGNTQQHSEL